MSDATEPTPMPAPQGEPYPTAPPPPKKRMGKGAKTLIGVGGAVVILAIVGSTLPNQPTPSAPAIGAAATSTTTESSTPTPEETYTPPVEETTPEPVASLNESTFGKPGHFTQGDGADYTVTVNKPTKPKCPYSTLSLCDKPETGDRFLTFKVVIKNESNEAITVSKGQFILEFGDGTRMEPDAGNAYVYAPDNGMDYDHQIRPGAAYTSTLTFEAPKANDFLVIMLDSTFGGDDLYGWTF